MSTDIQAQIPPLPHLAVMLRELSEEATVVEESGVKFAHQVMEAILGAETEEDLWRAQDAGSVAGKDYAGHPFMLRADGIQWQRSRQGYIDTGGFPFYFIAKVLDLETGGEMTINCGGLTIVAMVRKLAKLGLLDGPDGKALVIRANPAESGYDFLTVHPAPVLTSANGKGK